MLESCRKAGTVKRVIYTSSSAAVFGPRADILSELFPDINVAGDYYPPATDVRLHAMHQALKELGLKAHDVMDTMRHR